MLGLRRNVFEIRDGSLVFLITPCNVNKKRSGKTHRGQIVALREINECVNITQVHYWGFWGIQKTFGLAALFVPSST